MTKLLRYLKPYWKPATLALIMLFGMVLTDLAVPRLLQQRRRARGQGVGRAAYEGQCFEQANVALMEQNTRVIQFTGVLMCALRTGWRWGATTNSEPGSAMRFPAQRSLL